MTIAPTIHRYTTPDDDVHRVAEPRYFDPVADLLADGDLILVKAAGGHLVLFVTVDNGRVWTRRPIDSPLAYGQSEALHEDLARSRRVPPEPPVHPPITAVEGAGGAGQAAKQP